MKLSMAAPVASNITGPDMGRDFAKDFDDALEEIPQPTDDQQHVFVYRGQLCLKTRKGE